MTKLKNLVCQVLWADTGTPFREYAIRYGDGVVEAFIVVPDKPQIFTIRLTSSDFIYEGLSAAIWMDGHYQCNRNRVNLLPPKKKLARDRTEITFLFRQKETPLGGGMFMGREWRFDNHNIVPNPPEGVNMSHFDSLGEIEVLVRRCSAKNVDDSNASTTSSAAESDLREDEVQGAKTTEDADGSEEDEDNDGKGSAVQNDDEPLPFTALFDGPADSRRYSQSPGRETFGDWNWSSQPATYRQHEGYSTAYGEPQIDPSHRPAYHSPNYARSATSHIDHQHRPEAPPNYEYPPRSEKRVHFDHGQNQGPSADHIRYWDSHPPADAHPRGSFSQRQPYQAQGLSETQQARYLQMPGRSSGHQAYHSGDGRPTPPYVHERQPHVPPHFGGPAPQSQYSMPPQPQPSNHPHPSFAFPYTGSHAQPVQHWYPHSMYAVPQNTQPYHFDGYHSHYPPYAGLPVIPTASSGNVGNPVNQTLGSLDPAKEENSPNGGGWPTQNDSTTNQQNSANADNGWNTDKKDNENTNNDSGNWQDDNKDGGQNENSWDDNDNQATGNDLTWDNNGGNENNNSNCDTPNQNNNAQGSWDNTDQGASGGNTSNDWDKKSTKTTEGNAPLSTAPAGRSLYGPHGTYYNIRPLGASEPPCDAEEEPRYDVPQSFVEESGSRKQVQPGKGYRYYKKPCRLNYLDTLDEPYARFVFKYRTKEEMKKEVNIEVDTEPSGNEDVQTFQEMEKDELIRMLLRAQGALGGKIPSPPPQASEVAGEAALKGVVVDPPPRTFLEYELPQTPGININASAVEGSNSGKGGNDNWGPAPNIHDSSTNQNDNTANIKTWDNGGDGWDKGNSSNAKEIKW